MREEVTPSPLNPTEIAAINAFLKRMLDLTVYVVGCDELRASRSKQGSGLLWERGNTLTLLTVAHNFKGEQPRHLDPRFSGVGGSLLIEIPQPGSMAIADVNVQRGTSEIAQDVDFAWVNPAIYQVAEEARGEHLRHRYSSVSRNPNAADAVARQGTALRIFRADRVRLRCDTLALRHRNVYEAAMEYQGIEQSRVWAGCYRFSLARPHQGHKYYQRAAAL